MQKHIEKAGAIAAQIGFEGYEYATCISVNDEICHGFPFRLHSSKWGCRQNRLLC